jgi:elongation factor P
MDMETLRAGHDPKEVFGNDILYLKANTQLTGMFHEGKIVSYEMPKTVDLKVTDTLRASRRHGHESAKDAQLETGLNTPVPPFIEIGEVRANQHRVRSYLSRA